NFPLGALAMMDSLHAFYLSLEESPHDPVTLQALADWYEEQGNPDAADCLRWAVQHTKSPFRYRRDSGLTVSSAGWHDGWLWWAVDDPYYGRDWGHPRSCMLPRELWSRLHHSFPYDPAVFKEYETAQGAYEALIDAWSRRARAGERGARSKGEERPRPNERGPD